MLNYLNTLNTHNFHIKFQKLYSDVVIGKGINLKLICKFLVKLLQKKKIIQA
jgi:hypothetical protein